MVSENETEETPASTSRRTRVATAGRMTARHVTRPASSAPILVEVGLGVAGRPAQVVVGPPPGE